MQLATAWWLGNSLCSPGDPGSILCLLLFPWARNFNYIAPVDPAVLIRECYMWGNF